MSKRCRNCWWHDGAFCFKQQGYTKNTGYCSDYKSRVDIDEWIRENIKTD